MRQLSEKAVIARINRKLAHAGEHLHKSRSWNLDTLSYYVVDIRSDGLIAKYDSLEEVAREVGVLQDGETVAS